MPHYCCGCLDLVPGISRVRRHAEIRTFPLPLPAMMAIVAIGAAVLSGFSYCVHYGSSCMVLRVRAHRALITVEIGSAPYEKVSSFYRGSSLGRGRRRRQNAVVSLSPFPPFVHRRQHLPYGTPTPKDCHTNLADATVQRMEGKAPPVGISLRPIRAGERPGNSTIARGLRQGFRQSARHPGASAYHCPGLYVVEPLHASQGLLGNPSCP